MSSVPPDDHECRGPQCNILLSYPVSYSVVRGVEKWKVEAPAPETRLVKHMVDTDSVEPYPVEDCQMISEDKMRAAVNDINVFAGDLEPPRLVPEVTPFVELSQKLADSIVEVYQQQLTEIGNKLEEAKATAQQIRDLVEAKANDISAFKGRVEQFSKRLLEAHDSFTNGETQQEMTKEQYLESRK